MLLHMSFTLHVDLKLADLSLQQSLTKTAMGFILSTNAGKQAAAWDTGNHLTGKEKMVSHIQTDVATNRIATSEHSSSASPLEADQVNLHTGIASLPPCAPLPPPPPPSRPPLAPPPPLPHTLPSPHSLKPFAVSFVLQVKHALLLTRPVLANRATETSNTHIPYQRLFPST